MDTEEQSQSATCVEFQHDKVAGGTVRNPSNEKDVGESDDLIETIQPLSSAVASEPTQPDKPCPVAEANTYCPPDWALACPCSCAYRLEVIKNGVPLTDCTIDLTAGQSPEEHGDLGLSYCLIGRQPQPALSTDGSLSGQCMTLAHPSISRVHAVLQYGQPPPPISKTSATQVDHPGWYIQDLDSTHGTTVNKHRLPPGRFVRVHVGYVLRFGGSTRLHILTGPDNDAQPESEQSWTAIKQAYLTRKQEEVHRQQQQGGDDDLEKATHDHSGGCSWGISVDDEVGQEGNAFLASISGAACLSYEHIYRDDPKRSLNAYFEREGIDPPPQYEFVEAAFGKQHCRLELPLSSGTVTAEAVVSGKRKEATAACALEACRILDRMGEFDPNKDHSAAKKRTRTRDYWEQNDYYSSDEDIFVDRTGQIERRRLERIRQLGVGGSEAEAAQRAVDQIEQAKVDKSNEMKKTNQTTMLGVLSELEKVGEEIVAVEERLHAIEQKFKPKSANPSELDELEVFMGALKSDGAGRQERSQLRARLFSLRQTEMRLFKRTGLPQPRGCGSILTPSQQPSTQGLTDNGEEDVLHKLTVASANRQPTDAAAAVRAVKRRLEETAGRNSRPQKQTNVKSIRDAIKRSLSSHPERSKVKLMRRSGEDETPFVADEEDADDECEETTDLLDPSNCQSVKSDRQPEVFQHQTTSPANVEDRKQVVAQPSTTTEISEGNSATMSSRIVRTAEYKEGSDFPAPVSPKGVDQTSGDGDHDADRRLQLGDVPDVPSSIKQATNSPIKKRLPNWQLADPDYVTWVPPTDQKGDGITDLNAKYGY